MTAGSSIDYDALTQDALRGMVRNILLQVVRSGLPGEHHFYIAFNTQAPGVVLSRRLKEKYPDEMMIVLQHRFWDLAVTEVGFEVKLTFDAIPERLYIPFEALRVFFDPSVRFTLQFGEATGEEAQDGSGPRRRREGAEGPLRQAAARRGRGRARTEGAADNTAAPGPAAPAGVPQVAPAVPTVFAPRQSEAPRPVAVPAVAPAAAEPPAKHNGGAKVFSLDQFRKK